MKKLTKIVNEALFFVVFYTALLCYTTAYKIQSLFVRKKNK